MKMSENNKTEKEKQVERHDRRLFIYSTVAIVIGVFSICLNISSRLSGNSENEKAAGGTETSTKVESSVESSSYKLHNSYAAARDINAVLTYDNLVKYCKENDLIDKNDPNEEIFPKNAVSVSLEAFLRYMYKDIETNEDYSYIFKVIDDRDLGYTDYEVFSVEKLGKDGKNFRYLKRSTTVAEILTNNMDIASELSEPETNETSWVIDDTDEDEFGDSDVDIDDPDAPVEDLNIHDSSTESSEVVSEETSE